MSFGTHLLDILKDIKDSNFKLYLDSASDLRLETSKGKLEDRLKSEIELNKIDLIRFLKRQKNHTPIPKATEKFHYPVSSAQRRLYFLYELDKASVAYNMPQVARLDGEFNVKKMERTFLKLISRHENLRTYFRIVNGEVVQKIQDDATFKLRCYESNGSDVQSFIKDFIRPFDLGQYPLIRAGVVKINDGSHILMFDMHHIICDGVSQGILTREFMTLYTDGELPEQKLQYKDYSEWQQSPEQQERLSGQRDFWMKQFSDEVSVLDLPTDSTRPLLMNHSAATYSLLLNNEEKDGLKALSRETGATMFMTVLALYNVMLSKLSNHEDITIGTAVSGREHADLESVIGMFINTLPLRNYPTGNLTFREFLRNVKERTLSCFDNQSYQYEELIDELKLARDRNRNPLFDVVFAYHNFHKEELSIPGLNLTYVDTGHNISKFDLMLSVEDGDSILLKMEYSTELFAQETIQRFLSYFKRIVAAVIADADTKLSDIDIMSDGELNVLSGEYDRVSVPWPEKKTIVDLFEEQVAKTPDNTAIVFNDEIITYRELQERANALAYALKQRGVQKDNIVGLLMDRSIDVVAGMLGILKAGGAYLPLDINYPKDRITYLLKDSGAAVLVTNTGVPATAEYGVDRVFMDDLDHSVAYVQHTNQPSDLCYVIYTSGTTGNPKGVMIEHRNVVRLLFNDEFQFDFNESDVWTMFHSHCFDFSVWEIYGALLRGGKLVIVPQQDARDPNRYLHLIRKHGVTVLNQTPTAFAGLSDALFTSNLKVSSVRYAIFGGEALLPSKLARWRRAYPDVKLINMYGITETTVHVTYKEIGEAEISGNTSNIGKPIPTLSLYILDNNKHLVPKGAIGEMYVGGFGLARGYINKEALTQERFIDNVFVKGERLYKTGDLARVLPNGEIEYLGRSDQQVQLKGFRIELSEIEHHLIQYEDIDQTVVICDRDDPEFPFLCAYIVGQKDIPIDKVRLYLCQKIPAYMIPAHIIQIDKIPFNSNNKVNRAALPKPSQEATNNYAVPRGPQEEAMALIWAKCLSLERVGRRDNYFSLGGDSLKAIGLISEINNQLNCMLTIADLYSYQTIEDLAQLLSHGSGAYRQAMLKAEENLKVFQSTYRENNDFPGSYEEVYPMNGVEKGMVYHSMKARGDDGNIHNIIYHEQNIYPIYFKDFQFNVFVSALNLMIKKHSELRKIYDLESFAHIILKEMTPDVHCIDLSHLSPGEQAAFVKRKMHEEKLRRTELSFSVLWRMSVFKVNPNLHYLLFDMHHSLLDGWSLSSFITELHNTYFEVKANPNFDPGALKCTYRDQVLTEMASSLRQISLQYWREELAGYERLNFPTTGLEHEYQTRRFDLGKGIRTELTDFALTLGSNFKHICFAAYIYMVKMLSFSSDLTVGMVTNNRPLVADGEQLLGCFLNTVPFRAKISGDWTWREFITSIENGIRRLKEHDTIPMHKIAEITGETGGHKNSIYDTSFNYIDFRVFNNIVEDEKEKDYAATPIELESHAYMNNNTIFDFHVGAHNNGFTLSFTYSTRIITEDLCLRLYSYFTNILSQFLHNIDGQILHESILGAEERKKLLVDFNNTEHPYPHPRLILSQFEQHAAQTPDRPAVRGVKETLTFGEFNARVNQAARFLRKEGVNRQDVVAILLPRSEEMMVYIFAVLKLGAVYLPLDIDDPIKRNDYVLTNCKAKVALVSSGQYELEEFQGKVISTDQVDLEKFPNENLNAVMSEDDVAYIIYTSGSTGKPKGVPIRQGQLYNRLNWMQRKYPYEPNDRILHKTRTTFDVSVSEIFGWVVPGATLYALPKGVERDMLQVRDVIERERITITHFVPSALTYFLNAVQEDVSGLSSLRRVYSSGEALPAACVEQFRTVLYETNQTALINMYGPTEATIEVTSYDCFESPKTIEIPIGKPIDNTKLYILDQNKQLLPIGVKGEMYIGGTPVFEGYVNNQEQTSKALVATTVDPERRIYKTGDLAYWNVNGEMQYLGRRDSQIKIKGYRIELEEIEYQIRLMQGVSEVVATVLRPPGGQDDQLVAAVVRSDSQVFNSQYYRNELRKALPDYMVPAKFIQLGTIELTKHDKLDRKSIVTYFEREGQEDVYATREPNEKEKAFVNLFKEVLEHDHVNVNDNFFEIGGHSLLGVQVTNRIEKEFNIRIKLEDLIFMNVEQLALKYFAESPVEG